MFPQLGETKIDPAVNLAHFQEEKLSPKYCLHNNPWRNLSLLCVFFHRKAAFITQEG